MKARLRRSRVLLASAAALGATSAAGSLVVAPGNAGATTRSSQHAALIRAAALRADRVDAITASANTTTPIKHVVVIFQENVSFDHYFGTYPYATNSSGEPFYASPSTPSVNGLTPKLLFDNPNGANPRRLDPSNINDLLICDQDHDYTAEQNAFDNGAMDQFPQSTGTSSGTSPTGQPCKASDVMNYYDGNSATALWNYAQHFSMSDNSFGTTFGPSAPGAINLASGNTGGVDTAHAVRGALTDGDTVSDGTGGQTLISDAQPYWDDCSSRDAVAMTGQNVGNQLNAKSLSWGWFEGGFTPTTAYSGPADSASTYNQLNEPGRAVCGSSHDVGAALGGTGQWGTKSDYIPHHEPFQYYASTANPHHLAPVSLDAVGTDTGTSGEFDTANHQYDVSWFNSLVSGIAGGTIPASHLPAVSFLKAPGYEDGHAGYSDLIDEQAWLANEINSIEALPTWKSTAIFVAYDDSDGFYDHVYSGVTNPSQSVADTLTGAGVCGAEAPGTSPLYNEQGRCGYGPRLPLVVISPWAKQDYVSHTLTDQSSIIAFIEQNWGLGEIPGSFANIARSLDDMFNFTASPSQLAKPLVLSPTTGEPSFPVEGAISPTSGPISGGTTVTISGLNFSTTGGTTISFGGKTAKDVTCTASTTLAAPATVCTAVTPKMTSTQTVTVTVKVGTAKAVDDAANFNYTT
ncbi:MAG: alkaline phosphatase family protein [Acidimicrobiales bacterium]|jgi:phospholipase C